RAERNQHRAGVEMDALPGLREPFDVAVGELAEDEQDLAHAPLPSPFLLRASVADGAGRGNRTLMELPPRDFESRASTNSAIPALEWTGNYNRPFPEDSPCARFFAAFSSPRASPLPRRPIRRPRSCNTIAPTASNSSPRAPRRRARSRSIPRSSRKT